MPFYRTKRKRESGKHTKEEIKRSYTRQMIGIVTAFKVIIYFLAICFSIGTLIFIFKDLKPWRKAVRTKLWKEARIPNPAWPYLKNKKKK